MSYIRGLGKHVPARTLVLICQICGDAGWVQAAPIVRRVTGEGEKAFVADFTPVPCFSCQRIAVMA